MNVIRKDGNFFAANGGTIVNFTNGVGSCKSNHAINMKLFYHNNYEHWQNLCLEGAPLGSVYGFRMPGWLIINVIVGNDEYDNFTANEWQAAFHELMRFCTNNNILNFNVNFQNTENSSSDILACMLKDTIVRTDIKLSVEIYEN